jgi:oxalate decarboxylase/phosphoglucose isomerase-like protein (cupin superfamily)
MLIVPPNYSHVILNTSTGEVIFTECELDAHRLAKKMKNAAKKNIAIEVQPRAEYEQFAGEVQV